MADEMLVLEGDRHERYRVLLLFPIASPAQAGGANVVPAPTAGLHAEVAALLSAAEQSGLDGGTLAYRIVAMKKAAGLAAAQLATELRRVYAEQLADFNAEYARRYAHIGQRVSACSPAASGRGNASGDAGRIGRRSQRPREHPAWHGAATPPRPS